MEQLILSYGEFFHVTSRTLWEESVSRAGLDPTKGAECCAGRCEPSVFLCTREKLQKSINMIGTKYYHEDELVILRVDARTLIGKRVIGDVTYQRGIGNLEASLKNAGNLGCLDAIPVGELSVYDIVKNENKSNLV